MATIKKRDINGNWQTVKEVTNDFWFTNGIAYSQNVYLGNNDRVENWHEITEEEYNAIMAEREAQNDNQSNA